MSRLLREAVDKLLAERPGFVVYTASVWTDPDAAVSAVSFDTEDHSLAQVRAADEWAAPRYERLLAEGDLEQALLYAPRPGARNVNPADFQLSEFTTTAHRSFEQGWGEATTGDCWKVLEPALLEVRTRAAGILAGLPLHPDAELAVNSAHDWYDHPVPLRPQAA